jgi:amino acid transporter
MAPDGTPAEVGAAAEKPSLRRDVVGLPASTFQGVSHMAPAAGVILGAGFIASSAGAAFPLAFGLAGLISLLISFSIYQMAKHLPSAGGYYTYVSRGINPRLGFLAGWVYFLYDPLIPNLCTITVSTYVAASVQQLFGVPFPWWLYCIVVYAGLGFITFVGLRPSIRTAITFTLLEILITLALAVAIFGTHGVSGHDLSMGFTLAGVPKGLSGLAFGLIFTVLSYTGFESTIPLAEETRNPRRSIAWAAVLSVVIVLVYYLIFGFATVVGWGADNVSKTLPIAAAPYNTLAHSVWGNFGIAILTLALMNSGWGCSLAGQNAVIRVLYKMGQVGVLPSALARVHPRYRTPYVAALAMTTLSLVVLLVLGVTLGPASGFGLLATVISVGTILVYAVGMISVPIFYRREHPDEASVFMTYVFPIVGVVLLLPVLYASVWPPPAFPLNLAPYIDLAWIMIGVGVLIYLTRTRPRELEAGAETIFVDTGVAEGVPR